MSPSCNKSQLDQTNVCEITVCEITVHIQEKFLMNCLVFFPLIPQVIGIVRATDKDEHSASYRFSLASQSSNFSLRDYGSKSYAPSRRFVCACCSKRLLELPHLLPRNR